MSFLEEPRVVTAELDDGRTFQVEVRGAGDPEARVGIGDKLQFDRVVDAIEAIARSMTRAIESVKPDSASVEFGVDVKETLKRALIPGR